MTELSTIAERFYKKYGFPDYLSRHSRLVGSIAVVLAKARAAAGDVLDVDGVALAAFLHDIGRSPLLAGDPREHNELSALILAAEGLPACVEPARRHAIYTVLDPATAPRTIEERIVYVADRRGGMRIQAIEERATDTAARHPKYRDEVARAIPIALDLERAVFAGLPFSAAELAARVEVPG